MDTNISAVIGYRIKMDSFRKVIPEKFEMQKRFNPKTGKPTKPEKVILEEAEYFWVLADGRKFDEEQDFQEAFNRTLPTGTTTTMQVDYLYIHVKLPRGGKDIEDAMNEKIHDIYEFFSRNYEHIQLGSPRLYIIYKVF